MYSTCLKFFVQLLNSLWILIMLRTRTSNSALVNTGNAHKRKVVQQPEILLKHPNHVTDVSVPILGVMRS